MNSLSLIRNRLERLCALRKKLSDFQVVVIRDRHEVVLSDRVLLLAFARARAHSTGLKDEEESFACVHSQTSNGLYVQIPCEGLRAELYKLELRSFGLFVPYPPSFIMIGNILRDIVRFPFENCFTKIRHCLSRHFNRVSHRQRIPLWRRPGFRFKAAAVCVFGAAKRISS